MVFRRTYLLAAAMLLAVEVGIAGGVLPGAFVRGSVGDVLAIPALYFGLRGISRLAPRQALGIALAAAFAAEAFQYVHLADRLGFERGSLMSILLGTTFSVLDLLMYAAGGVLAALLDVRALRRSG